MRDYFSAVAGLLGGSVAFALGGWDSALQALVVLMAADYVSGLALAAVFKKSLKTSSGSLSSRCSFEGLFRKGMQLLLVLIGHQLDLFFAMDFVRTAVIIAFISNELLSITENAGLMGVPIPSAVRKAIHVLEKKA